MEPEVVYKTSQPPATVPPFMSKHHEKQARIQQTMEKQLRSTLTNRFIIETMHTAMNCLLL
jgi:hypothetical protein